MPAAANTGPTPVPEADASRNNSASQQESQQNKRDLASWWKQFKRSEKKNQEQQASPVEGIFGVPLSVSIRYANVAISLFNEDGQGYIYGYVPIVVAKCGVYLKEKATDVEGIFRLAGSEKRIKELKVAFDSPDRYGKGLDWTGYTVHDAANILRRYFNQLPEPIIPLGFYDRFRDPLRGQQAQIAGQPAGQTAAPSADFDTDSAIRVYQNLITELPPLNRQLLLYILDLMAVFASKSDLNKMTTSNLAAIFQPGLLSHPQHDMAPPEYRLSQDVLIFLIENQDSFLIGMPGTAADEQTVNDVQGGAQSTSRSSGAPPSPNRSKAGLGRSSSNASTATESRWGNLRRNVSVSSKQSKQSGSGPTPLTPGSTTPGGSGVQRSNTVPSRRTGSAPHSPRFSRDKGSDSGTQSPRAAVDGSLEAPEQESSQTTPIAPASAAFGSGNIEVTSASSSEATTPLAGVIGSDTSSTVMRDLQTPRKDTTPLLAPPSTGRASSTDRSASNTPSTASGRGFLNILKQSPSSDGDGRKPNKLQKKRIPGSALSSAQSSNHDLGDENADSTAQLPISPNVGPSAAPQTSAIQRNPTDATVRRAPSPSRSARSHTSVTDQSDADLVGDETPSQLQELDEKQKRRHRWRFSRSQNKLESGSSTGGNALGTGEQVTSKASIGSELPSTSQDSASMSPDSGLQATNSDPIVFSDSEKDKKGPVAWIRGKINERKEKEAEKRAKTPERKIGSTTGAAAEEGLAVRSSSEAGRISSSDAAPGNSVTSATPAQAALPSDAGQGTYPSEKDTASNVAVAAGVTSTSATDADVAHGAVNVAGGDPADAATTTAEKQ